MDTLLTIPFSAGQEVRWHSVRFTQEQFEGCKEEIPNQEKTTISNDLVDSATQEEVKRLYRENCLPQIDEEGHQENTTEIDTFLDSAMIEKLLEGCDFDIPCESETQFVQKAYDQNICDVNEKNPTSAQIQPIRKIEKTRKKKTFWTVEHLNTLFNLHDQYSQSHPCESKTKVSDRGWELLADDMCKVFPEENFTKSSCSNAYYDQFIRKKQHPLPTTVPSKWNKERIEKLGQLHDQYLITHPGHKTSSICEKGWDLLVNDMYEAFPDFSFSPTICSRAYYDFFVCQNKQS